MGLRFVNKDSVVVDCYSNRHGRKAWTLVNNLTGEAQDFGSSRDVVTHLKEASPDVKAYIADLVDGEKERRKFKTWAFFLRREIAPAIVNRLDASEHVSEWEIKPVDALSSKDTAIIRVNYTADKQLLFQDGEDVVFKDE